MPPFRTEVYSSVTETVWMKIEALGDESIRKRYQSEFISATFCSGTEGVSRCRLFEPRTVHGNV